jgi:ketosteroid isomerase-like protein
MSRFFFRGILLFAGFLLAACGDISQTELTNEQIVRIEKEIRQAANDHLHSGNAATALSHYTSDAIVASLGSVYPSYDSLASDVRSFYGTVEEVHVAEWEDMRVVALSRDAAFVTAIFHWNSTDTSGAILDMHGAWSALYIRVEGEWKMRAIHESVLQP